MTATLGAATETDVEVALRHLADELVSIALQHVNKTMLYILDALDGQITPEQRHHIRDLLTAAEGSLLTPPVRPADWDGF